MTTLALFQNEISEIDCAIASLAEQIAQYKQQKKQLAQQQKIATKAMNAIAVAKEALSESAFGQLAGAIAEVLGLKSTPALEVETVTVEAVEAEDKQAQLIEQSKTDNESNDFFAFQPTSNSAVASYFNIGSGQVQATYIGGNNKATLQAWIAAIGEYLTGINVELRKAKRMQGFKYELKIWGLNDDDLGWLTGFNFSETPAKQLECIIWSMKRLKRETESYAVVRHCNGDRYIVGSIETNEYDLWTAKLADESAIAYDYNNAVEAATGVREYYLRHIETCEAIAA